jgi:hypothetical protein
MKEIRSSTKTKYMEKLMIDCDQNLNPAFSPWDGWKLKEHVKMGEVVWDPQKVKLHEFRGDITAEVIDFCEKNIVFNDTVLSTLLRNQHFIPNSFFSAVQSNPYTGIYIHFGGTTWTLNGEILRFSCICNTPHGVLSNTYIGGGFVHKRHYLAYYEKQ